MRRVLCLSVGLFLLAIITASIYRDMNSPSKLCPVCDEPLEFRYAAEYGSTKAETFRCETCQSEYRCIIGPDGNRVWHLVGPDAPQ